MTEHAFRGDFFGPEDPARSSAVQVRIGYDGLLVTKETGQQYQLPFSSAQMSRGGFDGLAIVIQGRSEAGQSLYLQVADESFLKELRARGPATIQESVRQLLGQGAARRVWGRLSLVILLFVIVGGLLALYYGSGHLAELVVSRIPPSAEEGLGKLTAQSLMQGKTLITDGPIFQGVEQVWKRVLSGIDKKTYDFSLYVVDAPTVNALAAPGGHVVVFTGLLANLESAEELAGVLAHECAHALRRHSLKRIAKTAGISVAFSLFLGDVGGLTGLFTEFGKELALLSYSRDDEREADEEGVKILVRAAIDPTKFPDFFRRMAAKEGTLGQALAIVSTHPSFDERDRRLQELFKAHREMAVRPIGVDWKQLLQALSPTAKLGQKAEED